MDMLLPSKCIVQSRRVSTLFNVSPSVRPPVKAARKGRCLCVDVIAGWTTERLSTHRAAPCTILRPTVSEQKCLPKTQPEMLDPGHGVSYYFTDTRCEEEVSVIKWRVIESYFSLVARCSVAEAVDRFHSCRLGGRV